MYKPWAADGLGRRGGDTGDIVSGDSKILFVIDSDVSCDIGPKRKGLGDVIGGLWRMETGGVGSSIMGAVVQGEDVSCRSAFCIT
jgi:hypothetical protein